MSDEEGYIDDVEDAPLNGSNPVLSPEEIEQERLRREEAEAFARENAAQLEQVPDQVKKFIIRLHTALAARNLPELTQLYEKVFTSLSNEFYKAEEWPRAEVIASLVRNDQVFLTLYRDLYFRHLYSKFAANIDIDDRFDSYENYCNLFNYVLNSDGPVPLDLPTIWISDIIEEFIWQFGAFAAWRGKVRDKSEDELILLDESPLVWSCYSVLNVLYSLVQKSRIQETLRTTTETVDDSLASDEFASKALYRFFGYFSLLGLLRVHVLLGDYTLALMTLDEFDLKTMVEPSSRFHAVHSAHVSTFYYIGFAFLMMRRYNDAVDVLVRGVSHFHKNRRYTIGADQVSKTVDKMLALIAMAHSLSCSGSKLEDWVKQGIQDKYGEAFYKINKSLAAPNSSTVNSSLSTSTSANAAVDVQKEIVETYEDLFLRSCPKFVSPIPPTLPSVEDVEEDAEGTYASLPQINDPTKFQSSLFQNDVKSLLSVSDLKSFLKLFTTLSTDKMASLLGRKEEDVVEELAVVKGALRSVKMSAPGSSLLESNIENAGDVNFVIDNSTITISEARKARQVGDYFLRRSVKANEQLQQLKARPLPAAATSRPIQHTQSSSQMPSAMRSGGMPTIPMDASAPKTVAWGASRA